MSNGSNLNHKSINFSEPILPGKMGVGTILKSLAHVITVCTGNSIAKILSPSLSSNNTKKKGWWGSMKTRIRNAIVGKQEKKEMSAYLDERKEYNHDPFNRIGVIQSLYEHSPEVQKTLVVKNYGRGYSPFEPFGKRWRVLGFATHNTVSTAQGNRHIIKVSTAKSEKEGGEKQKELIISSHEIAHRATRQTIKDYASHSTNKDGSRKYSRTQKKKIGEERIKLFSPIDTIYDDLKDLLHQKNGLSGAYRAVQELMTRNYCEVFGTTREDAEKLLSIPPNRYVFSNKDEFVVAALTDPKTQLFLQSIDYCENGQNTKRKMMDVILESLNTIAGKQVYKKMSFERMTNSLSDIMGEKM